MFLKKECKSDKMFIFLNTMAWMIPGAVLAAILSAVLSLTTPQVVTLYGCLIGYPGLLIGFFGSIVYRLRTKL